MSSPSPPRPGLNQITEAMDLVPEKTGDYAENFLVDLDTQTQEIILAAAEHDLVKLKKYLNTPGAASVQDQETGTTPLHAAIDACGPAEGHETADKLKERAQMLEHDNSLDEINIKKAKDVVHELFLSGAIWNDLDAKDETPGCLAYRLGQEELYGMVVEAGVRAEMLMNLMGGYEELDSETSDTEEEGDAVEADIKNTAGETEDTTAVEEPTETEYVKLPAPENGNIEGSVEEPAQKKAKRDVNSEDYLASDLTFTDSTLLDSDANGVMMDWETPIMERTAELLTRPLKASDEGSGPRVLNVGFGMGIVDTLFATHNPSTHHILEAHPAVLSKLASPTCAFGPDWQSKPGHRVIPGKWQDTIMSLVEGGEQYDIIYFDTFGESYSQLKMFFSEHVIALLAEGGHFSFFNGLGADRRVCYDVYCRVAELDLTDAGFDVEWTDVPVDLKKLGGEGEGEWKGVKRRYWTLDTYRLPVAKLM